MKNIRNVSLLLFTFSLAAQVAVATPFRDGDTVVFLGDSITHGGRYHAYITDFYRTRFPEAHIRFVNSGISGDTAHGALHRISEDVTEYAPTHVAIHFGMNDIGRSVYLPESTGSALMQRERHQVGYRQNMRALIAEIRRVAPQAKLTYVTPTHYDDTAVITNAPANWSGWASVDNVGCNVGLSLMAGFVLSEAARDGVESVDWYSLMNNFIVRRRANEPSFMTTAIDRVHPGALGHSLMAWEFLGSQGVDPIVSAVTVDAATGGVVSISNAVADAFTCADGGVRFDLLAKAIPFPVAKEALPYIGEFDVENRLNLEVVAATGLVRGRYSLKIDGEVIGVYSDVEFAKGVRLGFNPKTPQYRQSQAVFARVEELRQRERFLRDCHAMRLNCIRKGAPVDDAAAFEKWFFARDLKRESRNAKSDPEYLKYCPNYRKIRDELWADQQTVSELAKPIKRHYEISLIGF